MTHRFVTTTKSVVIHCIDKFFFGYSKVDWFGSTVQVQSMHDGQCIIANHTRRKEICAFPEIHLVSVLNLLLGPQHWIKDVQERQMALLRDCAHGL